MGLFFTEKLLYQQYHLEVKDLKVKLLKMQPIQYFSVSCHHADFYLPRLILDVDGS